MFPPRAAAKGEMVQTIQHGGVLKYVEWNLLLSRMGHCMGSKSILLLRSFASTRMVEECSAKEAR